MRPHTVSGNMGMASISIFDIYLFFSLNCLVIRSGFDEGSPDGHDPLQLARTMASRGITLASFYYHFSLP